MLTGFQALHCGNSCLGRSSQSLGIRGYWINGTHHTWSDDNSACEQDAGIVCSVFEQDAGIPCSKSCTDCVVRISVHATILVADNTMSAGALVQPTAITTGGSPMGDTQQSESSPSLAALGGGLGGLCAILAILLVGVVIWSCHRRSGKSRLQER